MREVFGSSDYRIDGRGTAGGVGRWQVAMISTAGAIAPVITVGTRDRETGLAAGTEGRYLVCMFAIFENSLAFAFTLQ